MRKCVMAVLLSTSLIAVTGCEGSGFSGIGGMGTKQTVGTLGGAAGGGLLGSQIGGGTGKLAATAAGTLLGAFLGSQVGKSLDNADATYSTRAEQRAYSAPIGEDIEWKNPDSGHYGTITPIREGRNRQTGQYCRDFRQKIYVGGHSENATGRACQQPDGSWKIVS
jgi:surface antigen